MNDPSGTQGVDVDSDVDADVDADVDVDTDVDVDVETEPTPAAKPKSEKSKSAKPKKTSGDPVDRDETITNIEDEDTASSDAPPRVKTEDTLTENIPVPTNTPKKHNTSKKGSWLPSKPEDWTTVAVSGGVNASALGSTGLYANMFVDWTTGDIGFSLSSPVAVNPSVEASVQGSVMFGAVDVDTLVNGEDFTVSYGWDREGTDNGYGAVYSTFWDAEGNKAGTMIGGNASLGGGENILDADVSLGFSITHAGGHVNAYEISQAAIPMMERMIEDPAEGLYEAWLPIMDDVDVFGISNWTW